MSFEEDDSNRHTAKFKSDMIAFDKKYKKVRMENNAVQLCEAVKNKRFFKRNLDMELIDLMYKDDLSLTSDLSIDKIVNDINSSDETLQLLGIQAYARLKRKKNPSINTIDDDILPRCIKLLDNDNTYLQFQIASLLAIITLDTDKQMQDVMTCETVPKLVKLFKSSPTVAEQAVRALGNIIENKPYARDFALKHNALSLLADLIKVDTSVTFMNNISWLLSNLCQWNAPLSVGVIRPVLSVFDYLLNNENQYIISDTCRALSYLTDGSNDNIQAIMETAGILPKLLKCLTFINETIIIPALRTVGNIVTIGDDAQKNAVIFAGGLSRLRGVLQYYLHRDEKVIVEEAFWAIFKMVGNTDQVQSVMNADLLEQLLGRLMIGEQFENAHIIATWTVIALVTRGTIRHLNKLVQAGILQAFYFLLLSENSINIINGLIGMAEILHVTEKAGETEKLFILIKQFGVLDKIENLQYHKNERVYKESSAIINAYFPERLCGFNQCS